MDNPVAKKLQSEEIISRKTIEDSEGQDRPEKVTLADGTVGVFKPRQDMRKDKPFYDVAVSSVAEALGMGDLVPVTVVRKEGDEIGSLQAFSDGQRGDITSKDKRYGSDVLRPAALDFLVGTTDRHSGNWIVGDKGQISLIDNAEAFSPEISTDSSGLVFKAFRDAMPIPDEVKSWKWESIEPILKEHKLSNDEIKATRKRFNDIQQAKTFRDLFNPYGGHRGLQESLPNTSRQPVQSQMSRIPTDSAITDNQTQHENELQKAIEENQQARESLTRAITQWIKGNP